ncbi:AbrB/MazE/SpoVT family DNA-binding domain-containing protein [Patescibacteria group bacterium]|nr:AbrB/MazE/SpoVT family DNA-binding domain-containing protein [Patescibacteria group bacterium]
MDILKCTERGQITLPKKWRDQHGTSYYIYVIEGDKIVLEPAKKKTFKEVLDESWKDYLNGGKTYTQEEMEEKYGL